MNIEKYILLIGNNGPLILLLLSIFFLRKKLTYLYVYLIGYFLCILLNTILKGIFLQPRPYYKTDIFNIYMNNHIKKFKGSIGLPFDDFGMPSGHSQSVMYSTIFIYLVLKHNNIFYLYLASALLTCYQRVSLDYHSISQVIVGATVGSSFAYFVYQLAREKIKGRIREKPDDFGPL